MNQTVQNGGLRTIRRCLHDNHSAQMYLSMGKHKNKDKFQTSFLTEQHWLFSKVHVAPTLFLPPSARQQRACVHIFGLSTCHTHLSCD